jgi:hypothetical protein
MENYELKIDTSPRINRLNGQFLKNHKPFNKGIPMKDWMDGRKIRKVKKFLELGRKAGNNDLPGANRIPIVGIKDGKLYPFDSAVNAAKILKAKDIKVCSRNICAVIHCTKQRNNRNGKFYIRKRAGGFQWFFADEPIKYSHLLK